MSVVGCVPSNTRRASLIAAAVMALLTAAVGAGRAEANHTVTGTAVPEAVLGAPDHVGYSVHDIIAVSEQNATATGTEFGPVKTSTFSVTFPEKETTQQVRLKQRYSVRSEPFLELTEASPTIGPFMADPNRSTSFLSYAVDDVAAQEQPLAEAGMTLVAVSDQNFAFWRGVGGLLVKLVDDELVPDESGVNHPQAPTDLGPVAAAVFVPCDLNAAQTQLSAALGINWRPPLTMPLPVDYGDGHPRIVNFVAIFSRAGPPYLILEEATPDPHPWSCGEPHLTFAVDDVPGAGQQMRTAGMHHVVSVEPGIADYSEGLGAIVLEGANRTAFDAVTALP